MGDANQAEPFSEKTDSIVSTTSTHHNSEPEPEEDSTRERVAVLYSHSAPPIATQHNAPPSTAVCSSFEQLLLLLEDDRVDSILFDKSISHHEQAYITGWAKIFRPSVVSQKLPI